VIAHTVYSKKTIADIKRLNPTLLDYLNTNNVFIDVSASGSLMEIMLGPLFGVHPDNTSKKRIKHDLTSLLMTHTRLSNKVSSLCEDAKQRLPFDGSFPPFQLRTRRIQRIIEEVEYSAKTTVFVCAVEHRAYWEHLLVGGMTDNWLTSIGRFYLLRREDKTEALRTALCWHNKMLSTMKATFISGISTLMMDSSVKPPHNNKESPTLRQHLHKGGFITIISSNETNKWIGISADIEPAKHYVNTQIRDLCTAAYDDGTAPVATDTPTKSSRPPRASYRTNDSEDRTPLFEQQSKSWADITRAEGDDDTKFTSSTIAKRFPRVVKFKSKIRFDDGDDDSKEEETTKCSAIDTATAATSITIEDLHAMETRIEARIRGHESKLETKMKDDIGTAISDLSSNNQESFQHTITTQIAKHNAQILVTMKSMERMMQAMQQLSHPTAHTKPRKITQKDESDDSEDPLSQEEHSDDADDNDEEDDGDEIADEDDDEYQDEEEEDEYIKALSDLSTQPTKSHWDDESLNPAEEDQEEMDCHNNTSTKRSAPSRKESSPAPKRAQGGRGRGSGPGRGPGPKKSQPSGPKAKPAKKKTLKKTSKQTRSSTRINLVNRFEPLASSSSCSPSGSVN
jgi:hypothetical protein